MGLMKKLSTYLFLILFSFSAPSLGDDVQDFEIEGISIGDTLLRHMSEEKIITQIEKNKPAYNYLTEDFGEVYLYDKFKIYDDLSFFVKPNDKNYIIYSIRGSVIYDDKIKQCYAQQKEIVKEFSELYKNYIIGEETHLFPWDSTGKSNIHNVQFNFDLGYTITVSCAEYEKSLKIKNNWTDALSVTISTKEVDDWLRNY